MSDTQKAMLGTYARALAAIFLTAAIGSFLDSKQDIFAVDLTDLKTYIAAGVAAAIPVLLRWLNPSDPSYGLAYDGTDEDDEDEDF
jgi:hypothetical protein